jgi:hypothetical protein
MFLGNPRKLDLSEKGNPTIYSRQPIEPIRVLANDKVKWSFLKQVLGLKWLDPKWCNWVYQFVNKASEELM